MKVSIIIPVYNVSKYVERCLRSALDQTWKDLEIILVDDCTPDDSMDIILSVLETSSRSDIVTILKHEKNRGLSAARNTGIQQAAGDYLYFLDSDDYLPANSIELLANAAIQYDVDFVIGNYEIIGSPRWAPPLLLGTCLLANNKEILSAYSKDKWYVMAWNKLVRKSFVNDNTLFFQEGIIHEDDLWSFMLACKARKAYCVNQTTYYYTIQANSIMGKPSIRTLECRVKIVGYLYDYINLYPELKENPHVYILFESLKVKYFDRILYFSKDKDFQYVAYVLFRTLTYISPIKALFVFNPGVKLCFCNIHKLLPEKTGFVYFKAFVYMSYKLLIVSIKLRQWSGRE
ncbi:glycosyltransferase family 2 protein [uncultured Parabacteroides sp.]|uniref:glycosyltransferase family 2 protein n=1 Tax=uncultured Parabacteroides sp. TaxID=512312 RepID=UPI00260E2C8A|nr:glycosyltransferase family 2 protein [uncultured Parabacteroides sp.]